MKCYSNFNGKRRPKGKVHLPLISTWLSLSLQASLVNLAPLFQFYKVAVSLQNPRILNKERPNVKHSFITEEPHLYPWIQSIVGCETDFDTEPEISFLAVCILNIARSPSLCMKQSQSEMKPCTSNKQHKYLICSLMDPNMGFRGHVNDPTKWFVIVKLAIWGSALGVKSTFPIKQPAAGWRWHVHLEWEQKTAYREQLLQGAGEVGRLYKKKMKLEDARCALAERQIDTMPTHCPPPHPPWLHPPVDNITALYWFPPAFSLGPVRHVVIVRRQKANMGVLMDSKGCTLILLLHREKKGGSCLWLKFTS